VLAGRTVSQATGFVDALTLHHDISMWSQRSEPLLCRSVVPCHWSRRISDEGCYDHHRLGLYTQSRAVWRGLPVLEGEIPA